MFQVMLEDAGSQLAQLVQQARSGEEVIIISGSAPIAKIVSLPQGAVEAPQPGFGSGKHALIYMAEDFDAPLEDFKEYM